MATLTLAKSEITNIFLFFEALAQVGFMTGLIVIPLILISYEAWKAKKL